MSFCITASEPLVYEILFKNSCVCVCMYVYIYTVFLFLCCFQGYFIGLLHGWLQRMLQEQGKKLRLFDIVMCFYYIKHELDSYLQMIDLEVC